MKRIILAAFVAATTFATAAFAATTVPVPTMPSLATGWEKTGTESCKKPDGVVIARDFYQKKDAPADEETVAITKDAELVILFERDSVSIKQADGSWMRYEYAVKADDDLSFDAAVSVIEIQPDEFNKCVR